jgi:hypothetical protein
VSCHFSYVCIVNAFCIKSASSCNAPHYEDHSSVLSPISSNEWCITPSKIIRYSLCTNNVIFIVSTPSVYQWFACLYSKCARISTFPTSPSSPTSTAVRNICTQDKHNFTILFYQNSFLQSGRVTTRRGVCNAQHSIFYILSFTGHGKGVY